MILQRPKFKFEKTCQMVAYFLQMAKGRIDKYILIKLLYILDREGFKRWGRAVTFDDYVSLPYGPVVSQTYDLIKGETHNPLWDEHFSGCEEEHCVCLVKNDPDLGNLSRAERDLAEEVFEDYGRLSFKELQSITHNFPEYQDPDGGSLPISIESILQAVLKNQEEFDGICEDLSVQAFAEQLCR